LGRIAERAKNIRRLAQLISNSFCYSTVVCFWHQLPSRLHGSSTSGT